MRRRSKASWRYSSSCFDLLLSKVSEDPQAQRLTAIFRRIWCSLLGLGVPEMAQLILPLSLFLGLLMTLGKLYTESEITVMHACGLSKAVLVKAAI